ncbi:hypothetical protein Tco_0496099 [Tanacetum coccineum]
MQWDDRRNLPMIFEDQAERLDLEHKYGAATANVHSVAMSSRLDAVRSMAILEESDASLKEQFGVRKCRRVLLFTKPTADDAPKRVTDDIDKYVDAVYFSGFLTNTFSMMLDFYSDLCT